MNIHCIQPCHYFCLCCTILTMVAPWMAMVHGCAIVVWFCFILLMLAVLLLLCHCSYWCCYQYFLSFVNHCCCGFCCYSSCFYPFVVAVVVAVVDISCNCRLLLLWCVLLSLFSSFSLFLLHLLVLLSMFALVVSHSYFDCSC